MSIRDVAREAGVSVTTVSHALNGKGRVAAATGARVREVAGSLGYLPNPSARSLVAGRTGLIAAIPSLPPSFPQAFTEFGFYRELLGAASGAAVARDTAIVVAPPGGPPIWERVPLDGVIVIDPLLGEPALPALRAAAIPYVTIGADPDGGGGAAVIADDEATAAAMFDHLAAASGDVPALLVVEPVNAFLRDTARGYERWCAANAVAPRSVVMSVERLVAEDRAYVGSCLERILADGVSAVYAPIEAIGIDVAAVAREMALSVGSDLLLATTDDAGRAASWDPPLTAVTYDHARAGSAAAGLLLDLIDGAAPEATTCMVPAVVTPRASTGGTA